MGDLGLEAGESLGVVDQRLGADRVQPVDVDIEPYGRKVAAQFQVAERRDIDRRAAGQ